MNKRLHNKIITRLFLTTALFFSLTALHDNLHSAIVAGEVRETLVRMQDKWNKRDLLGSLAFFLNDPSTRLVRDGKVYQGWQEIYEHYKEFYEKNPGRSMTPIALDEMVIEVLNANTASVFFRYSATGESKDKYSGATFFIMKKSGPYWRISHGSMSSGRSGLITHDKGY